MNSIFLAKAFNSFILPNTALRLNLLLVKKSRLYVIKAEKKQKKRSHCNNVSLQWLPLCALPFLLQSRVGVLLFDNRKTAERY
ncbi:hypothetical protein BWX40_08700 [Prevotella intermedia]|nr:hypothetical protein BWX40_08700 [Prevotella intermedia]